MQHLYYMLRLCFGIYSLFVLLFAGQPLFAEEEATVYAPPDITITCDYWFPFNPNNPELYLDEFDARFGKIADNYSTRQKIYILDRVCPSHPRFNEYGPSSPFDDPCYDDLYSIYWGYDGYSTSTNPWLLVQTIVPQLHCGRGDILRRWHLLDPWGPPVASQRITIIDCKEFYVPTDCWHFTSNDVGSCDFVSGQFKTKLIEWPCDIEISRCQVTGPDAFDPDNLEVFFDQDREPRLDDDNCSLLAATFVDRRYTFVDGACIKIFRDWTVIDWCLYEDYLNGTYFGAYEWFYTQVIKLLNQNGPDVRDCEDRTVCGYGDPANPAAEQCVGYVEIRPGFTDDCTDSVDIKIDYKIDLFNDGDYDLLGFGENHGDTYPFPNPDGLPLRQFPDSLPNADGIYPVGTHKVLWGSEDGCGNTNVCSFLLTVEDCKPPTAYCLPGVSTIPMPPNAGGYVDVWASDFDIDSGDNCTADSLIRYSFTDNPADNVRRLTCDDTAGGAIPFTIYVWDEAGNYSTCEVYVLLTDCDGQTQFNISGSVYTETNEMMAEVMVHLEGFMEEDQMTDSSGAFDFVDLPEQQNYSIRPEKDTAPTKGVTTFDLVLISKHILGIEPLDSPYKMIAADINNSGTITTFDIVELRKLILYINTEFPSNTSWRFVDADYVFPEPANPFAQAFPEVYSINDLTGDVQKNFVAIKVGDVNNSAQLRDSDSADGRLTAEPLDIMLKDRKLLAGQSYEITFSAPDRSQVAGFQLALGFSPDQLLVEQVLADNSYVLSAANFGHVDAKNGRLPVSWHAAVGQVIGEHQLFGLRIRALKTAKLSDMLWINKEQLEAEAYVQSKQGSYSHKPVQLRFASQAVGGDDLILFQNTPNPFRSHTTIQFYLPAEDEVTLEVHDINGRLLFTESGRFAAGYHALTIERAALQTPGQLLYYSLTTSQARAARKMLGGF